MPTAIQPLVPKAASGVLNVVAIGRISTVQQNVENIEASYRYIEEFLRRIYQGPIEIKLLGEQASGMLTDRATIREAEELVAGGDVDLVISEDLARIYRNPRFQYDFVQNSVDAGTRVICIGDNLDTADENWEISMGTAALRHGLHVPDTRRRVRRTATHSFHKGGMVQKVRFGYRKLTAEEAASGQLGPKDLRTARRPECTPLVREMMDRVLRGESYPAIADWLNAAGVEPGPYVTSRRWSARLVMELLLDPILSGTRTFRDTVCRPIFRTGRHRTEKNAEPETEYYSQLAHISREEYAVLRQAMAKRQRARRLQDRGPSSRRNIPRSRSLWPGQSITCGICGRLMYYAGRHLKCSQATSRGNRRCWNRCQVSARLARERVIIWLVAEADQSRSMRQALIDSVWRLIGGQAPDNRRGQGRARRIADLERQAANLARAIAAGGQLNVLIEKLQSVEADLQKALAAALTSQSEPTRAVAVRTKAELASKLAETLLGLADHSFEFADWLRQLIPVFLVQPVQALDTPLVRPRGKFQVRFSCLFGTDVGDSPVAGTDHKVVLDLFEPPKHIRAIPECLQVREIHPHWSLAKIAARLNLNVMTVKRAFDYSRWMEAEGLIEPYRELTQRPSRASRWRKRRSMQFERSCSTPNDNPLESTVNSATSS